MSVYNYCSSLGTATSPDGALDGASEVPRQWEPLERPIPAAGHDWFLSLYDPIVSLLAGDVARIELLDQASIRKHARN